MNTCKETKKIIHYKGKDFNWTWGVKIRKIILFSILVFALLATSTLSAYAKKGKGNKLPISKTITVRITIPPRAELKLDEAKVDDRSVSINSKDLLNAASSFNEGDMFVDKVTRGGVELTRVTKVLSEGLYQDL